MLELWESRKEVAGAWSQGCWKVWDGREGRR